MNRMPEPAADAAPARVPPSIERAAGVLLVVLLVVVSWLAFSPRPPPIGLGWDKLNHAMAFAALAAAARVAGANRMTRPRQVVTNWLLAYGAFIELVQSQIPNRGAEWLDLLADLVGIMIGLAVAAKMLDRLRWHRQSPDPG